MKPCFLGTVKTKTLLLFGLFLLLSLLLVTQTPLAPSQCHPSTVGHSSVSTGGHAVHQRPEAQPGGFSYCKAGDGARPFMPLALQGCREVPRYEWL